jgi:hypothetical protein
MTADYDDRWNDAMTRYKAALADCEKVAAEITEAMRGGIAPDSTKLSKEEGARTRLFDARQDVLILLRERKARRTD